MNKPIDPVPPVATPELRPLTEAEKGAMQPFIETRKAQVAIHGSYHEIQVALRSQIGICNDLRARLQQAEEALVKLQASAVPSVATPCKYGNQFCPCQDGDPCHYEGENPMVPPVATPEEADQFEYWAETVGLQSWARPIARDSWNAAMEFANKGFQAFDEIRRAIKEAENCDDK